MGVTTKTVTVVAPEAARKIPPSLSPRSLQVGVDRKKKERRGGKSQSAAKKSALRKLRISLNPIPTRKDRSLTELSSDTVKLTSVCPPTYLPTYFRPRTSSGTVRAAYFAIRRRENISDSGAQNIWRSVGFHHAKSVEKEVCFCN